MQQFVIEMQAQRKTNRKIVKQLPFCIRWLNIEGDDRVVSLIPWVEGGAGSSRAPIAMPPLAV